MPPLTSSSLAPVSTGKDLFVYYQVDANIFEASSHDGGASWGTIPDPIVKDARGWGSPFTAYYNKQDADYDDKETVHLLYVNGQNKLVEQFKYITETKWETITSEVIANNEPTETSRITSGAVLAGPVEHHQVKHQFVYYESFDGTALNFTEIWRAPKSPWHIQTVLPGNSNQQPGSDLAAVIRTEFLILFYQDREGNIKLWENTTGWKDEGIFVSQAEVARQTPLAATSHGDSHIVFAGSNQPTTIKHRVYEGSLGGYSKTIDTGVQFYPGSHLGLVSHDDNVLLFYLDVHSGALKTKKYQKLSGWVDGVVVAA